MIFTYADSPIGNLLLAGDGERLSLIAFPSGCRAVTPRANWQRNDDTYGDAKDQLTAYFAGTLKEFDLPLTPHGTDFQRRVWRELTRIPFGETLTYGGMAARLGCPKAYRAVGAANGANPLSIVVPCHRLVGSAGALTKFGGGLERKAFLLSHEGNAVFKDRLEATV